MEIGNPIRGNMYNSSHIDTVLDLAIETNPVQLYAQYYSMVSKIIFDPKFIDVDFKRALFRKNEITRRWRPLLKFMSQRKFEFFVVANSMYYE